MVWDINEGRYTCVLAGGLVAHAARTSVGWELLVPGANIHELVRNPQLATWLTARPVIERLIRARMNGFDPHA
ncbi:MAG: hypothetical protein ABMB14_03585 [Myxococcota bacterium]